MNKKDIVVHYKDTKHKYPFIPFKAYNGSDEHKLAIEKAIEAHFRDKLTRPYKDVYLILEDFRLVFIGVVLFEWVDR